MLTKPNIKKAIGNRPWDLANKTLYHLCHKHPKHKNDEEIIAKVWTIGRTYSAAIERRKAHLEIQGYDFYPKCVAPCIRKSDIDKWFSSLKGIRSVDHNNLKHILEVHYNVINLFEKISGLKKRSLASKYLHFHFPDLFFLFDARAKKAIQMFSNIISRSGRFDGKCDKDYRKFCENCLQVRDHIKEQCGMTLTPRQLDNLLLDLSNSKSNN